MKTKDFDRLIAGQRLMLLVFQMVTDPRTPDVIRAAGAVAEAEAATANARAALRRWIDGGAEE